MIAEFVYVLIVMSIFAGLAIFIWIASNNKPPSKIRKRHDDGYEEEYEKELARIEARRDAREDYESGEYDDENYEDGNKGKDKITDSRIYKYTTLSDVNKRIDTNMNKLNDTILGKRKRK